MWSKEFREGMRRFNRKATRPPRPLPSRKELSNMIGCVDVEESDFMTGADNLAVALATYFSKHRGRPDDDEMDDETGWGKWVIEKTNEALGRVADMVLERMTER